LNNIALGKKVTIQAGGYADFDSPVQMDQNMLAKIDSASAGILGLSSEPTQALDLTGFQNLVIGSARTVTIRKPVTPAGNTYRFSGAGPDGYVSIAGGVLSGSNTLLVGSGTTYPTNVGISGAQAFTGGTIVMGGTLDLASASAAGTGNVAVERGTLWIETSGVNALSGSTQSLSVSSGASALLIASNSYGGGTTSSGTLQGAVDHALGTGDVNVPAGLIVLGKVVLPNDFKVLKPALLELQSGDVTVGGFTGDANIFVDTTSTLTITRTLGPGNGVGITDFKTANLRLASSAVLQVEIGSGGSDQVKTAGASVDGLLDVTSVNGFVATPGQQFQIILNTGSASTLGAFQGLPEGAVFPTSIGFCSISYIGGTGNDVVLTSVIPEPCALGLSAFALSIFASRRRR
jgi:hypothetical protein